MSKTQDKRAQRKAEQQAFIAERRKMQLALFKANFDVGMRLYEANKDKMSPEEIALVEEEIKKNRELLEKVEREANPGTQA
jgi:hypothetical protein